MSNEIKVGTADLILTAAIADYSLKTNQPVSNVRDEMIESGAYDALYDFDTGLWTQGPDYFIDFFLKMKQKQQPQGMKNAG